MNRSLCLCLAAAGQRAGTGALAGKGQLPLTGGVGSIDGAAGGVLTPWSVTGSCATTGKIGATAFVTRVPTQGQAVDWNDRLELSFARQCFDTGNNLAPRGLPGLERGRTSPACSCVWPATPCSTPTPGCPSWP